MLSCSNITLTRYRYNTGCKIKNIVLSYSTMVFLLKTLLSDISELKWNTNLLQWLLVFRYDTFMTLPVYFYATHKMLFAGVSFEFTIQSDFKWKHLVSTLPVKEWMIDNFFNIFLVSSCSWVHNENKFNEYKSGKTAALWLAYSTLNGLFYLCEVSIWDIFFLSPNLKNIVSLWSKN